jgi:hypothetical protein
MYDEFLEYERRVTLSHTSQGFVVLQSDLFVTSAMESFS